MLGRHGGTPSALPRGGNRRTPERKNAHQHQLLMPVAE